MKKNTFKTIATILIPIMTNCYAIGQCANDSNIYSFNYNGKTYEIVKENKTWIDAAACAVERGGFLTEINDQAENDAIFTELDSNANIDPNDTWDFVWIGGNDLSIEGNWVWDGNNDGNGTQFWMGDFNGTPVGGLYNNWGNEPDDSNGEDGLGLALYGWGFGVPGQWNDVNEDNDLYFVIEHPTILSINDSDISRIKLYPNPVIDFLTVEAKEMDLRDIVIFNSLGQKVVTHSLKYSSTPKKINLSNLNSGVYFVNISLKDGQSIIKKIIK